jgi:predicted metalloprotease with PDZ domain
MHGKSFWLRGGLGVACAILFAVRLNALAQPPIQLTVDVTDAPRKMLHAGLSIPVEPGPLTLVYPKWIPGEHGPTGPIADLTGLVISANGQQLDWRRDEVNMFAFHLTVPEGVRALDVKLDFLATGGAAGFSASASTSAMLAMLCWNQVLLYPEGKTAAEIQFQPSIKLPLGWQYATALEKDTNVPQDPNSNVTHFQPVSMDRLIDSPLLTGKYFREIPLAPETDPKHYLDLAADGPEDLKLKPEVIDAFNNLVRESGALFKSHHYGQYRFLVLLSDQAGRFEVGLEHHESSDDRLAEHALIDENELLLSADLLPHEFVHSWNGKFRRPGGLATGNYDSPMKGNLLWIYEGLTQYLGEVLAARSGMETASEYRDALAYNAALMDARPGRTWRNLEDTAVSAQILDGASNDWDNWRRGVDYYGEGALIWLDVDTTIRKLSKGKKSLNDFCAAFLGIGGDTPPRVVPYTFEDVVAGLNAVEPYDWNAFFTERLTTKVNHAPLDGITNGGYRIVYTDKPNEFTQAVEATGSLFAWWSIGTNVGSGGKGDEGAGKIGDVLIGSPADKAALGPGMEIIAVNGRQYSAELLKNAIADAKDSANPIELIVANSGYYKVIKLDYHGGLRYPHLEPVKEAPDRLDEILKPLKKASAKGSQ